MGITQCRTHSYHAKLNLPLDFQPAKHGQSLIIYVETSGKNQMTAACTRADGDHLPNVSWE
jgi:hypothetical protein